MINLEHGHNPEQQKETEKSLDLSVAFLRKAGSVEKMAEELEAAAKEGRLDAVMLDEYDLTIEEVNANIQRISGLAKEKLVDIILAADNKHRQIGQEFKQVSWDVRRNEIQEAGATLLDKGITPDEINDSVGFFFGKDGSVYAFPKTWKHPIHPIPNSRTAVAVCGEIAYLKPEDLQAQQIDLIYNPSREGDDPFLRYRMIGLANPEITDEEIDRLLQQEDEQAEVIASAKPDYSHLEPYYRQLMEEMDAEDARKPFHSAEEVERRKKEMADKIRDIIKNQKDEPSMYVRNIIDVLRSKHIPVVRSDGVDNSGLLNPSEATVKHLSYHETFTRMELKKHNDQS